VLLVGVALVALGTAMIPLMSSTLGLIVAVGIVSAGGAGIAGPAVLMAATARLVPPERRGFASGVVNAGGSFGQFVFVPIAQGITAAAGWVTALHSLAALTLLALPAAWVLRTRPAAAPVGAADPVPAGAAPSSLRSLFARAFALPSYRLLCAGFFVCGFHVAFIATHLPGVVASCQLPPQVGAWSLAVIGLFNILGSLTIGWAIGYEHGRWRMKSLLSLIYAVRALAVLVFVFAPKTPTTLLVFAAVIGFTYLSTVPPTAGLVARFFGPAHMATLFGVVMLSHQVGGFLGAWLGGKAFEATGSYDWMWWIDIVLAVGAALVHLPIDERPARAAAQAA
jgi:predicted MFS family arabinose efflux permease